MEKERVKDRAKSAKKNALITGNSMGDYLQKARRAAGVSQSGIAYELGHTTPQFISNWERNVSEPPIESLKKIAKKYKIDEVEFVTRCYQAKIKKAHKNIRDDFAKHYPYIASSFTKKGHA